MKQLLWCIISIFFLSSYEVVISAEDNFIDDVRDNKQTILKKEQGNDYRSRRKASRMRTRVYTEKPVVVEEKEEVVDKDTLVNEFDAKKKEELVKALMDRGVEFCQNNQLEKICHVLTHTKDFIDGELYLFLLDMKGIVYAHGRQSDLLWKNMWEWKDSFGSLIVQSIINAAKNGQSWVTYEWDGAAKVSFVKKIEIGGKEYALGCGYYPHSKEYATIGLVKGAVALFNQTVAENRPIEDAFSVMSYKKSTRFVFGDLYLYALDFEGKIFAQGERPGLVDSSALEYAHDGKLVNKDIIKKLQDKKEGEGIWVEYISKNALKRAYAEKVQDATGKYYFIASGYYPEIDRETTIHFVRHGYQFMKATGLSSAIQQFNDQLDNEYRKGDLSLFIYDMKGNCLANGRYPDIVNQNHFDAKDADGRYYVREMIEHGKSGGGWINFKLNNSFESVYVEGIDLGVGEFIIGSGMYPISKPETMHLLVKSAVGLFKMNTLEGAAERFVNRKDEFLRGDLYLFMIDQDGFCYAWGDDFNKIWDNILDARDEKGTEVIKEIIKSAAHGTGSTISRMNKRPRITYFEQVEKNNKKYVIGSGFYQ